MGKVAADDGVVGGDVDKDDVAGLGAGADVAGYVEGDGFSFAVGDNVPLERALRYSSRKATKGST